MDAAQALADLTEISSQIEAAVLAEADGSVVASTMKDEGRAKQLAEAAVELVAAGSQSPAEGPNMDLVQIQAATPRGSLFVARDARHVVAAITGSRPTVGLVFYDLKTCIRSIEDAPKPARRRPPAKKKVDDAAS
jgi:predicted regulator of Ras-like GTPase activity (Roadblock/LC7/MglB family)